MASPYINDLKSRVGDLERQLADAKARLHEAQVAESGVSVGQIVVSKGVEYRVTEVDATWADKPWLWGNQRKTDGSFGKARRALYSDWSVQTETV